MWADVSGIEPRLKGQVAQHLGKAPSCDVSFLATGREKEPRFRAFRHIPKANVEIRVDRGARLTGDRDEALFVAFPGDQQDLSHASHRV